MRKTQTRRSISISGATYAKLKAHCKRHNVPMSWIIEELLAVNLADEAMFRKPKAEPKPQPQAEPGDYRTIRF